MGNEFISFSFSFKFFSSLFSILINPGFIKEDIFIKTQRTIFLSAHIGKLEIFFRKLSWGMGTTFYKKVIFQDFQLGSWPFSLQLEIKKLAKNELKFDSQLKTYF